MIIDYISIPERQPPKSFELQTLIFVDSNDHVTPNHTFDQTFDIVSPKTKACYLFGIKGKPHKKTTRKKQRLFGEAINCKSYQRIFIANKGIRAFKHANDKGEYNPSSKK
jgi:hypothetical protein